MYKNWTDWIVSWNDLLNKSSMMRWHHITYDSLNRVRVYKDDNDNCVNYLTFILYSIRCIRHHHQMFRARLQKFPVCKGYGPRTPYGGKHLLYWGIIVMIVSIWLPPPALMSCVFELSRLLADFLARQLFSFSVKISGFFFCWFFATFSQFQRIQQNLYNSKVRDEMDIWTYPSTPSTFTKIKYENNCQRFLYGGDQLIVLHKNHYIYIYTGFTNHSQITIDESMNEITLNLSLFEKTLSYLLHVYRKRDFSF